MIEDYCPECGRLLSNDTICPFCDFSQFDEQMDNRLIKMFEWAQEDYHKSNIFDD